MDFDFFGFLDEHITRPRFRPEVDASHLYPSEASVKYYDEFGDLTTVGQCMRAAYFRVVGGFERISNSAYSEWIFKMGKDVENIIVAQAKEAGIWVDNNIKFYDKEYNISGEIDCLIAEPPNGVIVPYEIKSFYGYFAHREIFGNKSRAAQPKFDQLCQLLVYLWKFRDQFPYGRMAYFARDDIKRKTFKVALHQEGEIFYPVIDGKIFKLFTVNDILARYRQLQDYIDRKEVPPADYELQYSDAMIQDFAKKGKISKSKFEKWQKGKLNDYEYLGDWRCGGYCPYRLICYPNMIDKPLEEEE
jgi:hypothetical protein